MDRILQIAVANDRGGLTGYIVNNYRKINRKEFQFDFITYDDKLDFSDEVEKMGAKIFYLPRPSHVVAYYRALKTIQKQFDYLAVHFNLSYVNIVPILLAKMAGFKRIIVHSHSTGIDDPSTIIRMIKITIHHIGKQLLPLLATDCFACSKLAARWMFPNNIIKNNKYEVLYNSIDLSKFRFEQQKRDKIRKLLGIADDVFVIGHVGRFTYQKNHEFLIDVFQEIKTREPNSILLLVGDGPDREKIEKQVISYGLFDKVKFLGQRSDVADLYQAMDVLVLPSRFEGLCIVAIEAQMAALPNVCSEVLPEETKVSSDYTSLSLTLSAKEWADKVLEKKGINRKDNTEILRLAGYDADEEIKRLENLYNS